MFLLIIIKLLCWRNWIARKTSNLEVPGSSPGWGASFLPPKSSRSCIGLLPTTPVTAHPPNNLLSKHAQKADDLRRDCNPYVK